MPRISGRPRRRKARMRPGGRIRAWSCPKLIEGKGRQALRKAEIPDDRRKDGGPWQGKKLRKGGITSGAGTMPNKPSARLDARVHEGTPRVSS